MTEEQARYEFDNLRSDDEHWLIFNGINYIDNDEVIECEWFKTKQERNKKMEREVA
jgi:hypothetical protein